MVINAPLATQNFNTTIARPIASGLKSNTGLIVFVAIFCGLAVLAQQFLYGDQGTAILFSRQTLFSPFSLVTYLFVLGFFIFHTFYVMVFVRPHRLTAYIVHDLRTKYLTLPRLTQGLAVLILMQPFISAFSSFKSLIPVINPFYLDQYFMQLDRMLHGGVDPWIWLHAVLATPILSFLLNFFYNAWFFVMFGVVFWQAFSRKNQALRLQFFYTFLSLWVLLGVLAATALSSAGPVYYGRITGLDDPFAPLMAYLQNVNEIFPIWALEVQEMLWESYISDTGAPGMGISAMPSLHVAITVLQAFVGWNINRWLGVSFTVFAFLILLGSVHLGWHYAVDGYVSIVLTGLIWWAVGKWVRRSGVASSQ